MASDPFLTEPSTQLDRAETPVGTPCMYPVDHYDRPPHVYRAETSYDITDGSALPELSAYDFNSGYTLSRGPSIDAQSYRSDDDSPSSDPEIPQINITSTDEASHPIMQGDINQEPEEDPNLVTWKGPDDPLHPHNWPIVWRWTSTVLVAMFAFIAPMASTMVAPALPEIADEFDIESKFQEFLVMSVFLLAFAIGP